MKGKNGIIRDLGVIKMRFFYMTQKRLDALGHIGIDPCMFNNYPPSFIKKCVKQFDKDMMI